MKTPAQIANFIIGQKYAVDSGYHKGEVVTFVCDDETDCPSFLFNNGNTRYISLDSLTPTPVASSPSVAAGVFVGKEYVVLKDIGHRGEYFRKDSIAVMAEDDGTTLPRFKNDRGQLFYLGLTDIVEATIATRAGLRIGSNYNVDRDYGGWFAVNDTVTFTKDDKTDLPLFTRVADGSTGYARVEHLSPARTFINEPVKSSITPAEAAGLAVGDKCICIKADVFRVGQIVTLDIDDGSLIPLFRDEDGDEKWEEVCNVQKYVEPVVVPVSPAVAAGMVIGEKYEVVKGARRGDVLTFQEDDGSDIPYFTSEGGNQRCEFVTALVPYKEKTPAQKAGLVVGQKYLVIAGSGEGEVVTFDRDDGTICPYFKDDAGDDTVEYVHEVAPYVAPPAKTYAEEAGMVVGKQYRATATAGHIEAGRIGTFSEDDGSVCPFFVMEDGHRACMYITGVELVEDTQVNVVRSGDLVTVQIVGKLTKQQVAKLLDSVFDL